ncbi:MAG: metallophosphoesterase family protein [Thermotogota bacterium]|nr:metallophosphoesterase family protein [Thermotogota bacterium]
MKWTQYEIEKLISLRNQGVTWTHIHEEFRKDCKCHERPWETLRSKYRNVSHKIAQKVSKRNKTFKNQILKMILKEKTVSIKYISDRFGISEEEARDFIEVLRNEEYDIVIEGRIVRLGTRNKEVELDVKGNRLRLGVFSDLHFGSMYMQLTRAKQFVEEVKHKVDAFADCGDISDGTKIYKGQEYQTFLHGSEQHTRFAREHYPDTEKPTKAVGGNHDASFLKIGGANIPLRIAEVRENVELLGFHYGVFNWKGIRIGLVHPAGGGAYALSYPIQKYVRNWVPDQIPDILIFGHFHQKGYFRWHGAECFLAGCFQGQTPYLVERGLYPVIGGLVLDIEKRASGMKVKWESYDYLEIKDDWENYVGKDGR